MICINWRCESSIENSYFIGYSLNEVTSVCIMPSDLWEKEDEEKAFILAKAEKIKFIPYKQLSIPVQRIIKDLYYTENDIIFVEYDDYSLYAEGIDALCGCDTNSFREYVFDSLKDYTELKDCFTLDNEDTVLTVEPDALTFIDFTEIF